MKIGEKVTGVVTGIQPYGAFVKLENEKTAMIHISEVKSGFVSNIYDELKKGQNIEAQIIDIDEYNQKISLSLRTLESFSSYHPKVRRYSKSKIKIGFSPLKEQLPIWITEGKAFLKNQIEDRKKR